MKHLHRIIMAVAALLLFLVFIFPIWQITLIAPQYPDGVTLYIWINKLSGSEPGTLQNINILNHYVGMKMIEPDSIPELKYFPKVIYAVMALGLVFALIGKRWLYFVWSLILGVLGILGLYDFYLWEYDYGHNLSPTAPIKVPGMAYQPPLFGEKMLLNFTAQSYPQGATYVFTLAILLGYLAFRYGKRKESFNI